MANQLVNRPAGRSVGRSTNESLTLPRVCPVSKRRILNTFLVGDEVVTEKCDETWLKSTLAKVYCNSLIHSDDDENNDLAEPLVR